MKPYIYIAKMRILTAMAYRFDVFSTIAIQCLVMVATSFFWNAAYGTRDLAVGTSKTQMLTYIILSAVLSCVLKIGVEDRVQSSVRQGKIAVDMIKPVNMFGMYLAEDIGSIVVSLVLNVIPLLVIASIFIQVPLPSSFINLLLFLVSTILSFIINWLIAASFSMLAFWTVSISPMRHIKGILIRILSGSIIPLWFFPEWMQTVLQFLPFMYIYQLPLSIYIGRTTGIEILTQMSIQCGWAILMLILYLFMQKKITSNVLVQGG